LSTGIESSNRLLRLEVPAKAEYLSLVRLVVSGIADSVGLSNDSIADLKVALSEASSNVIRHAYTDAQPEDDKQLWISCFEDDGVLLLEVADHGNGMTIPPPPSEGLGFGIMGSLMDKVDVETDETGTTVLMEKLITSSRS
jgi:serine/threonine-protein kinase RsbW